MPVSQDSARSLDDLRRQLESAWRRSDWIFGLVREAGLVERGIPLRHPPLFYLGHLPAFAWNQLGRAVLDRPPIDARFDVLFERGIDPRDDAVPDASGFAWPAVDEVRAYRDAVRDAVRAGIDELPEHFGRDPLASGGRILHVVLEHELEHHETMMYLLQRMDRSLLRTAAVEPPPPAGPAAPCELRAIPAGAATLGAREDAIPFGWDNEFPEQRVGVEAFRLDSRPVTLAEFACFVDAGGYADPRWWSPDDLAWIGASGRGAPVDWRRTDGGWRVRALLHELPLEHVASWPVHVSQVEARAYLAWSGKRLPTEAELQRAAFGTPDGHERARPWGEESPSAEHGVFDFAQLHPGPAGATSRGDSAFGVSELLGNGWEWTSTPFAGLPGYRANIRTYPGYSADFFDDQHAVVFGAAWPTDALLLRRSFRNWYRARYPYAFTTFRGAREA